MESPASPWLGYSALRMVAHSCGQMIRTLARDAQMLPHWMLAPIIEAFISGLVGRGPPQKQWVPQPNAIASVSRGLCAHDVTDPRFP